MKDLVDRARAAVFADDVRLPRLGLQRMSGGMSHAVFTPVDDSGLVVKVFTSALREEPEREWEALVALADSGIAPQPVHFDDREAAVVVMTRVVGSALPAAALREKHALALGNAHRRVHRMSPRRPRPVTHSWVRAACESLHDNASLNSPEGDVFNAAWIAARAWVSDVDINAILSSEAVCFTRGDPNLTNYLWTGHDPVLIDWESSGSSDPVLEFADFAEHASSRSLADDFWSALADATGLKESDHDRAVAARRLMSCFWLVLIESRQREGRPTTVTLDEQAQRTLAVLAQ